MTNTSFGDSKNLNPRGIRTKNSAVTYRPGVISFLSFCTFVECFFRFGVLYLSLFTYFKFVSLFFCCMFNFLILFNFSVCFYYCVLLFIYVFAPPMCISVFPREFTLRYVNSNPKLKFNFIQISFTRI